jgi:ribosome recycling factor
MPKPPTDSSVPPDVTDKESKKIQKLMDKYEKKMHNEMMGEEAELIDQLAGVTGEKPPGI